jgi:hypothetical protein
LSVPEVCAPPELRTITPDSSVVTVCDGEADAPGLVKPPDPSSVERSGEVVEIGGVEYERDVEDVDIDDSSDSGVDAGGLDSELGGPEGVGDEGSSAQATPGVVATAPLTPSATASAPTRPMYLAHAVGVVSLELAEREPSEFAVRRLAAGPSRPLRRGDHAVAASDSAGKGSRQKGFKFRLEDFAGFMTHLYGSLPTAAFAVTMASKPIQIAANDNIHVRNLSLRSTRLVTGLERSSSSRATRASYSRPEVVCRTRRACARDPLRCEAPSARCVYRVRDSAAVV